MTEQIQRWLAERRPPTPCLVVDVDVVTARAHTVISAFPGARIRYAVKANPAPAVLRALIAAGMGFDVAGRAEIELCRSLGADPDSLSYGNTIKKPSDIAFARAHGVREFTSDAEQDLVNLARHAPGSAVFVRLLVDGPTSATPFGRKFGCEPATAVDLLVLAAKLGLEPAGVAFHVGSQQLDVSAWEVAIAASAKVFSEATSRGVVVNRLNIGGGFATSHREPVPSPAVYAEGIGAALRAHFPESRLELTLEPGRVVVADAGVIRTEVVLVSRRPDRWVYLDIGRYNGLAETENEAITYRFVSVDDRGGPSGPVVIAGPTCDGDDVLYQRTPYELPLSLRAGDLLDLPGTGAYTASYSSVSFNGIEPLRTYCLLDGRLADD
ncbi:MAG: speC [Amycolatopsis sp.]|uniref:type III PLP-dependent enzyme n=1 Tax=Amycolatopsis sp. TaxID=37632 RepID=UPI0026321F72|nr:type III PLP-dependent enzyme [Amycolatopsis sp.]MCU1679378.1 speC [Amycolatopsis sp.]